MKTSKASLSIGYGFFMLLVYLMATTSACSDSNKGNPDGSLPDICSDDLDPLCGEQCVSSVDCGQDLYCGPDKTCRADCTQEGDECGQDAICVDHGKCMDTCAGVEINLSLVTPTVMLLIDQSGSMTEDFGGKSRWDAVESSLVDPDSGVVFALQDEVRFGVSLYTSHGGFSGGECPLLRTVEPSLNNADAIKTIINDNEPDGDTPTGESLKAVTDIIKGLPADPDNPGGAMVIVLATDGEPDTCSEPNPQNGQQDSIEGAQYAFENGIGVVILSVGREVSTPHLQDMANAGSGLPIGGAQNAPFYVADDPQTLLDSFDEIIQNARACVFALDGKVEPLSYAKYGKVSLNGQELTYDDPDGWTLVDASTLKLQGAACQTFLDKDDVALSASFPCGALVTD